MDDALYILQGPPDVDGTLLPCKLYKPSQNMYFFDDALKLHRHIIFRLFPRVLAAPGSIPVGVTEFFSDIFPSDRTIALGSAQPLVKMSTRNITGGKGGRCVRLTTSRPSLAECHEIWEPKPPGILWATPGL